VDEAGRRAMLAVVNRFERLGRVVRGNETGDVARVLARVLLEIQGLGERLMRTGIPD
jgi:hypothetical protein